MNIFKQIFGYFLVAGYRFGTTVVPYNEEDQKEYGWKRENRCLKLIQFTKRSQISKKTAFMINMTLFLYDFMNNFFKPRLSHDFSLIRYEIILLLKLN